MLLSRCLWNATQFYKALKNPKIITSYLEKISKIYIYQKRKVLPKVQMASFHKYQYSHRYSHRYDVQQRAFSLNPALRFRILPGGNRRNLLLATQLSSSKGINLGRWRSCEGSAGMGGEGGPVKLALASSAADISFLLWELVASLENNKKSFPF